MNLFSPKKTPELIVHFFKLYPTRFIFSLIGLLFAGFIETIGISAILPLLNTILGVNDLGESNSLIKTVNKIFILIGYEKNLQNLLIFIELHYYL